MKLSKGKSGRLVISRLYGGGTPFIRYTGMGDIIKLKDGICDCGLETELIENVHGRIKESIVLPDEKVIFPDTLANVPGKVMHMFKTEMINRIQIVQNSLNKIEVLVIIDEDKRKVGVSVETFLNQLKTEYRELFGSEVELEVREVTKLVSEEGRDDSTPGVLSKIDVNKYI
jgi:phenylacetate-coenzyme A ligase PaaK-like adenylate-forming protein